MRVLPSGSTALLVELDGLDDVLGLYAALTAEPLEGVVDVVPAARTVLLVTAGSVTSSTVRAAGTTSTTPSTGSAVSAAYSPRTSSRPSSSTSSAVDPLGRTRIKRRTAPARPRPR